MRISDDSIQLGEAEQEDMNAYLRSVVGKDGGTYADIQALKWEG